MAGATSCPRCGYENDPSFAFCNHCGQGLREGAARSCSRCGAALPAGFRFCGHCGQAAEAGPPRPTAPSHPRSPAAPPGPGAAPPRLVRVRHDGQPGAPHALDREVTICGRKEGDLLLPDDGSVSPRHAAFTVRDGRIRVEDLGSGSGTFLRLRSPRALTFGDEIRLGRQLLRLEPMPRPAAGAGASPWGSADPGYRARLLQLLEGGGVGEVFPLRAGANAVGRETGEVAFPGDRYVSGRHARVDVGDAAVTLTDLGSSNGTFLRVSGPTEIGVGDQVLLGMQLLRVEG